MSAQQMNANMQISSQASMQLSQSVQDSVRNIAAKQANKPSDVIAKEGPVVLMSEKVLRQLEQTAGINAVYADSVNPEDLQLKITQPLWMLDFSMMSSDYVLSYGIHVSLYQKKSDTIFFDMACTGEHARKMPKEDWERDDFAAVAEASKDFASKCAEQVVAALKLQSAKVEAALPPQTQTQTQTPTLNTAVAVSEPKATDPSSSQTIAPVSVDSLSAGSDGARQDTRN